MAFEFKEGMISLFRNNKKTEEKHPDYTGKAMVNGVIMYVSLWVRQLDGNAQPFLSGQIQPPRDSKPVPEEVADDVLTPTPTSHVETTSAKDRVMNREGNPFEEEPKITHDSESDLPF